MSARIAGSDRYPPKFHASCALEPGKLISRSFGSGGWPSLSAAVVRLREWAARDFKVMVRDLLSSKRPSTIFSKMPSMRAIAQNLMEIQLHTSHRGDGSN